MSDSNPTPEPVIDPPAAPGPPLLWQAMRSIEALGLPMVEKLFWSTGCTIQALYRLAQRTSSDRVQIVRVLEILERQTEGIVRNPDRSALDDAMVKADRLLHLARQRRAMGNAAAFPPKAEL